ncbi:YdbL family protein [Rhodocista pekingensis]|uniref:YdbL family protein n=1 Tax=Rhodocista pekingensis TaxID=201185 RepID=A0ABW2KSM8_9PROT
MKSVIRIAARLLAVLALAGPLLAGVPAMAQESLVAAKQAGLVGEKPDGLVGFVKDEVPADVRSMVDRVNAERRKQYAQVAQSTGQSLAQVQAVAGDRLVGATPSGQYVMNAAGRWTRK